MDTAEAIAEARSLNPWGVVNANGTTSDAYTDSERFHAFEAYLDNAEESLEIYTPLSLTPEGFARQAEEYANDYVGEKDRLAADIAEEEETARWVASLPHANDHVRILSDPVHGDRVLVLASDECFSPADVLDSGVDWHAVYGADIADAMISLAQDIL